jgi:hypothetical protein
MPESEKNENMKKTESPSTLPTGSSVSAWRGFLFFLIKGLLWLIVPALMVYVRSMIFHPKNLISF